LSALAKIVAFDNADAIAETVDYTAKAVQIFVLFRKNDGNPLKNGTFAAGL